MRYFLSIILLWPLLAFAQQSGPVCGNGVLDSGEQCDDGNDINYDGCFECKVVERSAVFDYQAPSSLALDPNKAFRLSITTTIFGPPGLGLIYGPSMGHFYAGEVGHGVLTSLLRAGLIAGQIAGQVLLVQGKGGDKLPALLIVDSVALAALVYYDLLDGPRAVARRLARGE